MLILSVVLAHALEMSTRTAPLAVSGPAGKLLFGSEQGLLLTRSAAFCIFALGGGAKHAVAPAPAHQPRHATGAVFHTGVHCVPVCDSACSFSGSRLCRWRLRAWLGCGDRSAGSCVVLVGAHPHLRSTERHGTPPGIWLCTRLLPVDAGAGRRTDARLGSLDQETIVAAEPGNEIRSNA